MRRQNQTSRTVAWTRASLLGAAFLLVACGGGGTATAPRAAPLPATPPPAPLYVAPAELGDGWSVAAASELDVSEAALEQLLVSLPNQFPIVDSLAIAFRGRLILDATVRTALNRFDAWVGNTDPRMHVQFSVSKSIAAIAIGAALAQGLIVDVDTPFLDLFAYADYANPDPRKAQMRLHDVLTMQLGLDWDEWDPPYTSSNNQMLRFYETEVDYSKALLDLPVVQPPGSVFAYSTPAAVALGQAIENAAPMPLLDFLLDALFTPLDIQDVEFLATPTGLPDLGRGVFLRTRDLAKFGQLFAGGGRWNDREILAASWIETTLQPHVPLTWLNPADFSWRLEGYGYQWWIGQFDLPGRAVTGYAARGYGQQVLMVIPALELVVAVNSHAFNEAPSEVDQVFRLIRDQVIPALPLQ